MRWFIPDLKLGVMMIILIFFKKQTSISTCYGLLKIFNWNIYQT